MSSSEKLRALDDLTTYPQGAIARSDAAAIRGRTLLDALPQIVAVVEAAEQAGRYVTDARDSLDEDEMEDGEPSVTAARLMAAEIVLAPALADLEKALT